MSLFFSESEAKKSSLIQQWFGRYKPKIHQMRAMSDDGWGLATGQFSRGDADEAREAEAKRGGWENTYYLKSPSHECQREAMEIGVFLYGHRDTEQFLMQRGYVISDNDRIFRSSKIKENQEFEMFLDDGYSD